MITKTDLKEKAVFIRDEVLRVALANGAGHIAPSLSPVEMLTALYYGVMDVNPDDPQWEGRDRLVFSKAHGCYALYAILADLGMIPRKEWDCFYTPSSSLLGCMERRPEYGLEAGCGSLGHGLPMAVGIAYGAKLQQKAFHTFCITGDGEFQEGSFWEALQFAVKHEVNNLTVLVDCNRLQAMDFITNILDKEEQDLFNRIKGFGTIPVVCSGHDVEKLNAVLAQCKKGSGQKGPNIVMAQTIKGYGLKCMENVPKFHFRIPSEEEVREGRSDK